MSSAYDIDYFPQDKSTKKSLPLNGLKWSKMAFAMPRGNRGHCLQITLRQGFPYKPSMLTEHSASCDFIL